MNASVFDSTPKVSRGIPMPSDCDRPAFQIALRSQEEVLEARRLRIASDRNREIINRLTFPENYK